MNISYTPRRTRRRRLRGRFGACRHVSTRALELALGKRDIFLRTVAHDLKTPLTGLSWQVEQLVRRSRDGQLDPVTLEAGLTAIASGAAQAVSSLDELHALTRPVVAPPGVPRFEAVDLVAHFRDRLAARAPSTAHTFVTESAEETLVVASDRARLGSVFDNLFDNAIKYSPPGSQIRVILGRTGQTDSAWASIRVQDQGVGIPAADLPRVFEPYQRARNVACTPGEGLGLASVRHLIESLGGRVEVESQEAVGSTFSVFLPLR